LINSLQGLVEFYNETSHQKTEALTELECHGPYRMLKPGQTMETSVEWTLLDYKGEKRPDKHISFLKKLQNS